MSTHYVSPKELASEGLSSVNEPEPLQYYQSSSSENTLTTENAHLRKEIHSFKQIVELQKMVIELLKKELDSLKR
jgi:hypothetical protein